MKKLEQSVFFLIDAIQQPIEAKLSDKIITQHTKNDFPYLLKKIREITDKDTKIILVKKIIYEELYQEIRNHGFNVINTEILNFPSHDNQPIFRTKLKKLIDEIRIQKF